MMKSHTLPNIHFHYLVSVFNFTQRKQLKKGIAELFHSEKKTFDSLTYVFCSDKYLLGLNKQFLQHNYFTDIITFDLSEQKDTIIGELYISIDRVKVNAKSLGETFATELRRVIIHGALHLCGYRDKTKKDTALMRQKEDYYLNRLG